LSMDYRPPAQKGCPGSVQVRQFASFLRYDRIRGDINCSKPWWTSVKDRHPDLAVAVLAAIESRRRDVRAENVR
jgi:hypothetical protein